MLSEWAEVTHTAQATHISSTLNARISSNVRSFDGGCPRACTSMIAATKIKSSVGLPPRHEHDTPVDTVSQK